MINQAKLQYYCSDCRNILRETEYELGISRTAEPCPFCGSLLSESLQKRHLAQSDVKPVMFQAASGVPRLAVDMKKLCDILPFLSLGQKVLLVGRLSQKLVERLAVRAQLPRRYGGLDSDVVIVDGGNSSDPYLGISFARQYGLDVNQAMSRIVSSRAFTVHQLENLVVRELPEVIKKYGAKLVVISDMLAMFEGDPFLDGKDAGRLLQSILEAISNMRDCLVVASVSARTKHDHIIKKSFDRIISLDLTSDGVTICVDEKACAVTEDDLEVVKRR